MENVIGIIEKRIRNASWEDAENMFTTFRHLAATLEQDKGNILCLVENKLGMLCLKVQEMVKDFEEKEILRIKQCLQDFFEKNSNTDSSVLRNEMRKIIRQEIGKEFDVFRNDSERAILKSIQEAVDYFLWHANNIIQEFKIAVEILFEIPMGQFEYSVDIYKGSNFYCIAREYTKTSGNKFHFISRYFLSQPARRKLVFHEMIAEASSCVSRNCDRVLCDIISGICSTIEYYASQLKDLGNHPIVQIGQAIQEGLARRSVENGTNKLDHRRLLTV
ncbi:MAG: hypothetical protein E3K37_13630 [Candidatus Kuenenia sp.]|nr:hypothetical protein [Candidatus Kuenenia hertensis]